MSIILTGDQQAVIGGKLAEISRQVFLQKGYGFDPNALDSFLQRAIEGRFIDPRGFAIWRTIKLGTGPKNATDFRKALKDCGIQIGDWANDILGKPAFTVAIEETEVDLVKVSVSELGFDQVTRYDKICERAKESGLLLCQNEVGPQLRLQYKDQPKGEVIRIAMEAIRDSDGDLEVFNVEHNGNGLWLSSVYGSPDRLFSPIGVFVFVRPRK